MKLSVLMITYNHEKFIVQAIDSALNQNVDFDYEIVIGEDCSTDRTREIVVDFQKRFPEKIRLLLPDENVGMMKNFALTLQACRGDYVALLEGDDYWTSPSKLQRQVEFLDDHPDYAICFHNVEGFNEEGEVKYWNEIPNNQKETSTIEDLLISNFISTCSTMFRRNLFGELPAWFYCLNMGDWPLHILNAQYGKVGYLNDVMGRHRVHSGGVWSMRSKLQDLHDIVQMYESIGSFLGYRYARIIDSMISKCHYRTAIEYEKLGNLAAARDYALRSLITSPTNKYIPHCAMLELLLRLNVPLVYRALKHVGQSIRLIMRSV